MGEKENAQVEGRSQKKDEKVYAPGEDRTHDLQITLYNNDYETDALPTAPPRRILSYEGEAILIHV